jgi:hypothetical protein
MKQTITSPTPIAGPASGRYEQLLTERIRLGRLYVDAVCHRAAFGDAERLFAHVQGLDRRLDRFRRYSNDQLRLVMPAEDERWHVPGEPPAGPECHLCAKQALGLLVGMVLPATRGRAA